MVNWDPGTRSAISDLEVEQRAVEDTLYLIDYPLESGSGSVTVATVRPETMLADTAIAVNPTDERYTRLIGETAILPLVGRRLPIIADDYVDPEFGTGALKITPGHDPNDFEIGRQHGLDEVTVIGEDGRMTDAAGERFAGHDGRRGARGGGGRAARGGARSPAPQPVRARRAALAPLGHAHRAADLAPVVLRHGRAGRAGDRGGARRAALRFHPEQPWTERLPRLAREHPALVHLAPALVGPPAPGLVLRRGDETYVGERAARAASGWELRATRTCSTPGSRPALWPFATLGWPEETPELRAFYPTDVLVDRARHHLPLGRPDGDDRASSSPASCRSRDVPIHSVIQAPDGRRMSKSLGTGIDPLDEIDAARRRRACASACWRCPRRRTCATRPRSASSRAQDLANKLWNASRLCCCGVDDVRRAGAAAGDRRGPLDRVAARAAHASESTSCSTRSSSRARRSSSTTSSGPRSATGTSSSSSRASTTRTPTAALSRRRCCTCSSACWRCCTRSCRS